MFQVSKQLVAGGESHCTLSARTAVNLCQVDVTGYELSKVFEEYLAEDLGHNIRALVLRGNCHQLDSAVIHVFPQKMVSYIDVFGSLLGHCVVSDLLSRPIVFIDDAGFLNGDTHRLKKHIDPD